MGRLRGRGEQDHEGHRPGAGGRARLLSPTLGSPCRPGDRQLLLPQPGSRRGLLSALPVLAEVHSWLHEKRDSFSLQSEAWRSYDRCSFFVFSAFPGPRFHCLLHFSPGFASQVPLLPCSDPSTTGISKNHSECGDY